MTHPSGGHLDKGALGQGSYRSSWALRCVIIVHIRPGGASRRREVGTAQNLSLQADARLRGATARTYLALTAKERPSEAQLAIALQALSRPLDGSEHAEVAPPNLAEIFKLMPSSK